jgi:ABC-type Fe3+ transport system permease subunit
MDDAGAFIIPSFINVIAWTFLAATNSGYLNKLLVSWLGFATPPFNIFGRVLRGGERARQYRRQP